MAAESVPIAEAMRELRLTRRQMRGCIKRGAPVAVPGRKGRGGAAMIDLAEFRGWLALQQGARPPPDENLAARELLAEKANAALGDSLVRGFRECEGPHKKAVGAALLLTYLTTAAATRSALKLPPVRLALPQALAQMDRALRAI